MVRELFDFLNNNNDDDDKGACVGERYGHEQLLATEGPLLPWSFAGLAVIIIIIFVKFQFMKFLF